MSRLLHLTLLAVIAVLALTTRADAANPCCEDRRFRIEVTGAQVTDWRYRSSVPLDDEIGWTRGEGTQTIGFETKRPGLLLAQRNRLRRIGPIRLPAFEVNGATRNPKLKANVRRTAAVDFKDRPPVCEGGTLDDECLFVPLSTPRPQQCGRREVPLTGFVSRTDADTVHLEAAFEEPDAGDHYTACAPDTGADAFTSPSEFRAPLDVEFGRVAPRLARVGRGRTVRLHAETRSAGCRTFGTERAGFASCATTSVFVELTRTR